MRSPPYPSDLTDEQWSVLQPLLPRAAQNCRPRRLKDRQGDDREVNGRTLEPVIFLSMS